MKVTTTYKMIDGYGLGEGKGEGASGEKALIGAIKEVLLFSLPSSFQCRLITRRSLVLLQVLAPSVVMLRSCVALIVPMQA